MRYAVFAWDERVAKGGWNDLQGRALTMDAAVTLVYHAAHFAHVQVVDLRDAVTVDVPRPPRPYCTHGVPQTWDVERWANPQCGACLAAEWQAAIVTVRTT